MPALLRIIKNLFDNDSRRGICRVDSQFSAIRPDVRERLHTTGRVCRLNDIPGVAVIVHFNKFQEAEVVILIRLYGYKVALLIFARCGAGSAGDLRKIFFREILVFRFHFPFLQLLLLLATLYKKNASYSIMNF